MCSELEKQCTAHCTWYDIAMLQTELLKGLNQTKAVAAPAQPKPATIRPNQSLPELLLCCARMISKIPSQKPIQSTLMTVNNYEETKENEEIFLNQSLDSAFSIMEMERLNMRMRSTLAKQVMVRSSKVLELHPGTSLVLPPAILNTILQQIVLLAAPEPSGVRGGTLVVLFEPPHPANRQGPPVKIGRYALDPGMVSTFELHLTLQVGRHIRQRLADLVRRMQGKSVTMQVDHQFLLIKKKLYRSSVA